MTIDLALACEGLGGAVTAVGGLYAFGKRLIANSKRKKEEHKQAILEQAKEEAQKIVNSLEDKVKKLEVEFRAQEMSISKDLSHFKETYNNELKVLGEKIESLRQDISQQHQALVGLLTKLVDR